MDVRREGAACGEADGMVGPPMLAPVRAADAREAVARALAHEFEPETVEADVVRLTVPDGAIVRSLRREG